MVGVPKITSDPRHYWLRSIGDGGLADSLRDVMKANNEDSPKSAKTHPFDLTGNEFSKTISFIGLSRAFSNALRNASKRMMIYRSSKCNGLISLLKPGIY